MGFQTDPYTVEVVGKYNNHCGWECRLVGGGRKGAAPGEGVVSLDEMEERLRLLPNHRFDSAVVETQLLTRVGNRPKNTLFFNFFFLSR